MVSLLLFSSPTFNLFFCEIKASIAFPFPNPCNDIFFTFFSPKLSFSERLNKIVLSTPVSKIKDNFVWFTSTGIRIILLINWNDSFWAFRFSLGNWNLDCPKAIIQLLKTKNSMIIRFLISAGILVKFKSTIRKVHIFYVFMF